MVYAGHESTVACGSRDQTAWGPRIPCRSATADVICSSCLAIKSPILPMQAKSYSILDWARQASMGCELAPKEAPEGMQLGTFLGGCFWGLELAMQRVPGVVKTSVGYTGGDTPNPTYETVCSGRTGHAEAVQVRPRPSAARTCNVTGGSSQGCITQLRENHSCNPSMPLTPMLVA